MDVSAVPALGPFEAFPKAFAFGIVASGHVISPIALGRQVHYRIFITTGQTRKGSSNVSEMVLRSFLIVRDGEEGSQAVAMVRPVSGYFTMEERSQSLSRRILESFLTAFFMSLTTLDVRIIFTIVFLSSLRPTKLRVIV